MDDRAYTLEGDPQAGTPTITHPPGGSRVGVNVALWGTATPGSQVEILDGTDLLASADVDDTGFWGVSLRGLRRGEHEVQARAMLEDEQIGSSAPLRLVVGAAPAEKRRRLRPILAAAGVGAAVVIAAGAFVLGGAHLSLPGASSETKGGAPPARPVPTRPAAPAPARTWSFPAPAGSASQAILALNNPGSVRAAVTILIPGGTQHVTLRPQGEAEMELGARARTGSIRITSTAPIIAERIVVSKGKTSTSYGSHR